MDASNFFTDTVTYAAPSGVDSYGEPSYGAQTTVKARVQSGNSLKLSADVNTLEADYVIYADSRIPDGSRVWLPGDDTSDNSEARRIVSTSWSATRSGSYTLYKHML